MLTTGQVLQRRRFAPSPSGGFASREVDAFVDRILATLGSYERTGTPDAGGVTADDVLRTTFTSVVSEPSYGFLDVQDFLDSVHETLAILESRVAYPPQAMSLARATSVPAVGPGATTWTPQGADPGRTAALPVVPASPPVGAMPRTASYGERGPAAAATDRRRAPTNLSSAVGVLSRTAARAPAGTAWSHAPAPVPAAPAPEPMRGMDVDALIFELQRASAESRSRGALHVEIQTAGGAAAVLRVVEATPGTITIIAQ